jgi:hypothetical protein
MPLLLRFIACLLGFWVTTAQAQVLTQLSRTSILNGGVVIAANATRAYAFTQRTPLTILTYDVSIPTAPVGLANTTFNNNTVASACALVGTTLYSTSLPSTTTPATTTLLAFDVSTATPRLLKTVTLSADKVLLAASGSVLCALTSSSTSSLTNLLLFSNELTQLSSTSLPSAAIALTAGPQTAYVQYVNSTAFIAVDLTTPTAPLVRPSQPGSIGATNGQLAYGLQDPTQSTTATSPDNTLTVYDVSSPLAPRALRTTTGQIGRTLVAGTTGVFTLRTNPTYAPANPSRFPLRAYAASLSAPTPVASNEVDIPFYTSQAVASGTTLYVIDGVSMNIYSLSGTPLATRAATLPAPAYPNPTHGTLHLPHLTPGTAITITDALGRPSLQAALPASGTLDLSALPAGLYLVRAGEATTKLIVE